MEQPLGAGRRAFEGGEELGRGDEVAFALPRPEEAVGALALVVEQVVEGEAADGAPAAPAWASGRSRSTTWRSTVRLARSASVAGGVISSPERAKAGCVALIVR